MLKNNHSRVERIIWGNRSDERFLFGIIPNSTFESAYENENYWSVLVLYPNHAVILNFMALFEKISKALGEKVLPVFSLVERGVLGSYFVVYLRKDLAA